MEENAQREGRGGGGSSRTARRCAVEDEIMTHTHLTVVGFHLVRHFLDGEARKPGIPLVGLHVFRYIFRRVVDSVQRIYLNHRCVGVPSMRCE